MFQNPRFWHTFSKSTVCSLQGTSCKRVSGSSAFQTNSIGATASGTTAGSAIPQLADAVLEDEGVELSALGESYRHDDSHSSKYAIAKALFPSCLGAFSKLPPDVRCLVWQHLMPDHKTGRGRSHPYALSRLTIHSRGKG